MLERQLGEGGTAVAYLTTRRTAAGSTPVVMKVMRSELVAQSKDVAELLARKEAVALARLNEVVPPTPFVVRYVDVGTLPLRTALGTMQLPWVAVEYVHGGVEGTTLEERIKHSVQQTGVAFDRERVARLAEHMCAGLEEVHRAGIVHRDLTPGNILCCGFGENEVFKISDFALARPSGMQMTFGAQVLGTPGYMSPEQLGTGKLGVQSDIFAVAAIIYLAFTGEDYFRARSPIEALATAQVSTRRMLGECSALAPELRSDSALCQALDELLAQASAFEAPRRPASARSFGAALVSLLRAHSMRAPSARHATRLKTLASAAFEYSAWALRHPPGDDRIIYSAGWDSDGHCLATTSRGLEYWNGSAWLAAPLRGMPVPEQIRCLARVGPGRWVLGGDRMTLAEYSYAGVTRLLQGPEPQVSLTLANGEPEDIAVFVGQSAGSPPLLCAVVGERWLKPFPVPALSNISSISRLDDERWLVTGRSVQGRGYVGLYAPLRWEIQQLPAADERAYIASACRHERAIGLAAGSNGMILRLGNGSAVAARVPTQGDLCAAAVDVLDREWVAGPRELWAGSPTGDWQLEWHDPNWPSPFVSVFADVGQIVALGVDGAVLESHVSRSGLASLRPPAAPRQ